MICYNVPLRAVRQAFHQDPFARLGAAGAPWRPSSRRRRPWRSALVATITLHGLAIGLALLLISQLVPPPPPAPPVLEMLFEAPAAPQPAAATSEASATEAPAVEPREKPPRPVQAAPSPAVAESPPVLPPPEPPAVQEVALPLPPPRPPVLARRAPPAPARAAMPRVAEAPAPAATAPPAAPAAEPVAPAAAPVSPGWRQVLAAWLAQHKNYPEEARRRGDEGTVVVRFSLDRSGRVVDVSVLRGSGSSILDAATVAMLHNAVLPAPPAMSGEAITVSVRVHYALTD